MHATILPEVGEVYGRPVVRGMYKAIRAIGNMFAWFLGMTPLWVLYQMATGRLNEGGGWEWIIPVIATILVFALFMALFYGLARILPGSLFTPGDWFITMVKASVKNDSGGAQAAAKPLCALPASTPQEHAFVALAHEVLAESGQGDDHWRQALDHLSTSADLGLDSLNLRIERARSMNGAGDHDGAIALLESLEKQADVSPELWSVKSLAYLQQGDKEAARSTLEYLKSIADRWPLEAESIKTRVDADLAELASMKTAEESGEIIPGVTPVPVIEGDTAEWLEKQGSQENGWKKVYATLTAKPEERVKIITAVRDGAVGELGKTAALRAINENRYQNAVGTMLLIVFAALFAWGAVFLLASAAVALKDGAFGPGFLDRDMNLDGVAQFISLVIAFMCIVGAFAVMIEQVKFRLLLGGHFPAQLKTTLANVGSLAAVILGSWFVASAWISTAENHHALLVAEGYIAPSLPADRLFRAGGIVWQPTAGDKSQLAPAPSRYVEEMRTQLDGQLAGVARSLKSIEIYTLPEYHGMITLAAVHSDHELTIESLLEERRLTHEDALAGGQLASVQELRIDTVAGKPAVFEAVTSADGRMGRTTKILLGPFDYIEYTLFIRDAAYFSQWETFYLNGLQWMRVESEGPTE